MRIPFLAVAIPSKRVETFYAVILAVKFSLALSTDFVRRKMKLASS
jgi:hypothetical protein